MFTGSKGDPRQIYNIQNTILGENIDGDSLSEQQKKILSLLSWVPSLNGGLLERVMAADGLDAKEFVDSIENLILGCLIVASGSAFSISPASLLIEQKRPKEALALLDKIQGKGPEEWILYARALDTNAELSDTLVTDAMELRRRAAQLRAEYNFTLEYEFADS
jgi:hypothetical protein